jgi:hypothetical protein
MRCLVCEDCGWVCENHPDQPSTGPHESPAVTPQRAYHDKAAAQKAREGGWRTASSGLPKTALRGLPVAPGRSRSLETFS